MNTIEDIYQKQFANHLEARGNVDIHSELNEFDTRFSEIADLLEILEDLVLESPGEIDKQAIVIKSMFTMAGMLHRPWEAIYAYCRDAERSRKADAEFSGVNKADRPETYHLDVLGSGLADARNMVSLIAKITEDCSEEPEKMQQIDLLVQQVMAHLELSSSASTGLWELLIGKPKIGDKAETVQ